MTLAVSAATGQLGRLVLAGLKGRTDVVALVRDPAKAADLGFPVRAADYARAETLVPALDGVTRLLLISSSEVGQRAAQHRNVLEAASAAGVGQVIYTSLLHADRSLSLAEEHRDTEAALKASGLDHVILRNGWYTENYLSALPAALAHGALAGSAGTGRIASAARADYAAAAVAVLTGEGFAGRTLELAGDEAWTLADLAAEVSRQTGREVPYHDLPQADYAKILEALASPPASPPPSPPGTSARRRTPSSTTAARSRLIGRPTTPLSTSVADALATVPA